MIMQEKKLCKTNSEFVEFVSIPQKLHPFKNPHRIPTELMGIHHSPHTHGNPHGNPHTHGNPEKSTGAVSHRVVRQRC